MKIKTSTKNEACSSKQARVTFKTNEIESVKTFATEVSEEEEEEEKNESDGSEMEEEVMHDAAANAGWADVMQKILKANKPKRKRTVVLAKAKKLCDVKLTEKREDLPFEIDGSKEDNADSTEISIKTVEHTDVTAQARSREKSHGIRVKPSITDRERERLLQKIVTKGVVQLFNAVRQQQTEINKKMLQAGPLERKREQVLKNIDKNAFLDILMGGSKSIVVDNPVKADENMEDRTMQTNKNKENKTWSVLRDDFVMGAKLKDWDKRDAEEEDSSAPEDMDSDD